MSLKKHLSKFPRWTPYACEKDKKLWISKVLAWKEQYKKLFAGTVSQIQDEIKQLRTEMRDQMTNGWSNHERSHFQNWLKEEIEPHFPKLYEFLTSDKVVLALLVSLEKALLEGSASSKSKETKE